MAAAPTIASTALPTPTTSASATPLTSPVLPPCPANWTRPAGSTTCYRHVYLGAPGFQQEYAHAFCKSYAVAATSGTMDGFSGVGLASARSYAEAAFVIGGRCGGMPFGAPSVLWSGQTDTDTVDDPISHSWIGLQHVGSAVNGRNDSAWEWLSGAPASYITGVSGEAPGWWWPAPTSLSGECSAVSTGSRARPRPRIHEVPCSAAVRYACCEISGDAMVAAAALASPIASASPTPAPAYGSVGDLVPGTTVSASTGIGSYRLYRIVVPVDGDVTVAVAPRSADATNVAACGPAPSYSWETPTWWCQTPLVQVFTAPTFAPGLSLAASLPASNTPQSTVLYRQAAKSTLYFVVVGRPDVDIGFALTASVAASADSAHALPGLPSSTPLPSTSPYALVPFDVSSPDPFYTVVNATGSALPVRLAHHIGGGQYHYFAFTSPPLSDPPVTFRVTLVPSPGSSKLALSISRTPPTGFQNNVFAPSETSSLSYWAPQVIYMVPQRPDYAPSTIYYVRVSNNAAPSSNNGDANAGYSLLIDPYPAIQPPGVARPLVNLIPGLSFFDNDAQSNVHIYRATSPGTLSLRWSPVTIAVKAGVGSLYLQPSYEVRVGSVTGTFLGGASTCCDGRLASSAVQIAAPGDVVITAKVQSFNGYADYVVYALSAEFAPSGPEASVLPSATPLPSTPPTPLPAPAPNFYSIQPTTLPFTATRDLPASQYHYYRIWPADGLFSVTLTSHYAWAYGFVDVCTVPPSDPTLSTFAGGNGGCAGSMNWNGAGDTTITAQGGWENATYYLRVRSNGAATRYTLTGSSFSERSPPVPGSISPVNEGDVITASVIDGTYHVWRFRASHAGTLRINLKLLWSANCATLSTKLYARPIFSSADFVDPAFPASPPSSATMARRARWRQ